MAGLYARNIKKLWCMRGKRNRRSYDRKSLMSVKLCCILLWIVHHFHHISHLRCSGLGNRTGIRCIKTFASKPFLILPWCMMVVVVSGWARAWSKLWVWGVSVWRVRLLIPMTHAPQTGAINRLHFLAPVFGAGFSYHMRLEWKFLAQFNKWWLLLYLLCAMSSIKPYCYTVTTAYKSHVINIYSLWCRLFVFLIFPEKAATCVW